MLIKQLTLAVLLFSLASCGEKWDEESENAHTPPVPTTPQIVYEPIVEKEKVTGETFLTDVEVGETIVLTISGKMNVPMFGPSYQRSYRSFWDDRHCERDPICPMCFTVKRICFDIPRKGQCNLKYRNYNGQVQQDILFSDKVEDSKLRLKIGDNLYPLGRITNHGGMFITTEFTISKEMLQESNEVSLAITPDANKGNVRTGFLGYGSCQGKGRRHFRHEGSTSSRTYKNQIVRDYLVTAHFKRIKR
jgi:hypothetical protein